MKDTGMTRRVDELGRVVIPIELRRTMGIAEGMPLEIYVDGDSIILRRHIPCCAICGETHDDMIQAGELLICPHCAARLGERAAAKGGAPA